MKKIIMLFPIIFIISIVTSCSDYMNDIADDTKELNLNDGLVAYWPMNEYYQYGYKSYGTLSKGYAQGNDLYLDSTNNGEGNGNYSSVISTTGKYGNAFLFDANGSFATLESNDLLNGKNECSVSFWIKDPGGNYPIIATNGFEIKCDGFTSLSITITSTGTKITYPPTWAPAGKWTYVTGTYDEKTIRLYINGSLVASENCTGPITTIKKTVLCALITEDHHSGTPPFQQLSATLDEFRIYNRALNEDEIKLLMKTGIN